VRDAAEAINAADLVFTQFEISPEGVVETAKLCSHNKKLGTGDLGRAIEIGAKAMALSLAREGAQESMPYRSGVLEGLSDIRVSR